MDMSHRHAGKLEAGGRADHTHDGIGAPGWAWEEEECGRPEFHKNEGLSGCLLAAAQRVGSICSMCLEEEWERGEGEMRMGERDGERDEVICGNMRANGARIALQDNATRG